MVSEGDLGRLPASLVDASLGWVHVDGGSQAGRAIKIMPGVVLEVDRLGRFYGIWLRPEKLPGLADT